MRMILGNKIFFICLVILGASGLLVSAKLSGAQTEAKTETINTLDYFVSDHLDKGLAGSHNQNQTVIGNASYYTKWSHDAYEIHTWDDEYIYLKEDRSWKKDESYAFGPGKWMKRQMNVGESIQQLNNFGYYVNSSDCSPLRINALPYAMTLEEHNPRYQMGGDLGEQDVIVLKYDYSNAAYPGNFERFYYSKEWGWVKWELYENNSMIQDSVFNTVHNQPIKPKVEYSCTEGGTVLPAGNNVAGPALMIRLNQAVQLQGTDHLYYITPHAERQYICSAQVLRRYGEVDEVPKVDQDELRLYPVVRYVRFAGSDSVYRIDGYVIHRLATEAVKNSGLDPAALTVFNTQDFSCYQVGSVIYQ